MMALLSADWMGLRKVGHTVERMAHWRAGSQVGGLDEKKDGFWVAQLAIDWVVE